MDYELAKKLMDGGFPQNFGDGEFIEGPMEVDAGGPVTNNSAYAPTLSELIAACGNPKELFRMAKLEDGRWGASRTDEEYYHGATPEEAVAMLYLALHETRTPVEGK